MKITFKELMNEIRFYNDAEEKEYYNSYRIYNGSSALSAYYIGGHSDGKKGLFKFSKIECLLYKTKKEAEEQIKKFYDDLEYWINVDIKEQAKNWKEHNRQEFLDESKETYYKLKKFIGTLKIRQ